MAQRRDSGPDPSAVRTWLVVSASSEPEAEPCARPHVRLNEPTRSSDAIVAVRSRPPRKVKSLPKAAVALEKKGRRKKTVLQSTGRTGRKPLSIQNDGALFTLRYSHG